jgi:hypothetical protein
MSDSDFSGRAMSQDAPAIRLVPVVPDDAADLPGGLSRALYVGAAGVVVVTDTVGNTVPLTSAAAQYHPIRVRRVLATGTTAAGIVALY